MKKLIVNWRKKIFKFGCNLIGREIKICGCWLSLLVKTARFLFKIAKIISKPVNRQNQLNNEKFSISPLYKYFLKELLGLFLKYDCWSFKRRIHQNFRILSHAKQKIHRKEINEVRMCLVLKFPIEFPKI